VKSNKTVSIIVLAGAIIGALVLVLSRSSAVEAAYPVEHAAQVVRRGVVSRIVGLFKGGAMAVENARLRREIASFKLAQDEALRLEAENARLRRVLDYVPRLPNRWLPAGVLSFGGGAVSARDILRADKGSLSGVQEGAVVVVPEGLVGRVTAVTPHTSEITLVTDPSLKVACEIATGSPRHASGILSGGGGGLLILRHFIGCDAPLSQARVFTSGRGGVFPRGLEIGTLQVMTNDVRGVRGEVLPRVDYSALEDVFIRCAK